MTTALTAHIAREIRAEMGRQRMSQAALARRLGTSQAQLSRVLGAHASMTVDFVSEVAAALGVPVEQLLDGPRGQFPITPVIGATSMLGAA